jgi:general bacterial porin, GBP family
MQNPPSLKVLALAACAVLLPGLAAAQSSVTITGRIDMGLQAINNGTDTVRRADSGTYTASRFVFRGVEDLGSGLSALFHLENGFSADNGSVNAARFFNRGSYVGLSSKDLGTLTLGRQYVPIFWPMLFGDDAGPHRLHGYSAVQSVQRSNFARVTTAASPIKTAGTLDSIGGGLYSIGISSAFEDNLVIYKTPSFSGLTATAAVGAPEGYPSGNGKVFGGNLEYRSGPLYLGYGINSKEGRVPVGSNNSQKIVEQAVTAMYGVTKEINLWGNVHPWSFESNGTDFKGRDWMLGVSWRTGPNMVWANYSAKALQSGCNACDSRGFGIGYHYSLSRRTELYAGFAQVNNDANSANSLVGVGPSSPGKSVRGTTVGVAHVF